MQRVIDLGGVRLTYESVHSARAKHLRLIVRGDGTVTVRVPSRTSEGSIERFVRTHHEWILENQARAARYRERQKNVIRIRHSKADYIERKDLVHAMLCERVEALNARYGFHVSSVKVKHMRTRWGSCSRRGALNFNFALHALPSTLVDYVVVHELCHLKEFNHSPHFWALVAQEIPEYRERRRELRRYVHT